MNQNNKEVVLAAVKQDGHALPYADKSLKKDKEVVLAAVKQNGIALYYADESLKKDKEVVLSAVIQNGYALEYADESLKKDKEVVLSAVIQNGHALEYADESLKKDKEFVLAAVKQNGNALCYADESLKKDNEFIQQLIQYTIFAYRYINDGILTGKKFNELFPNCELRKKIKNDMMMKGFKYQIGINKDTLPFNPTGECKKGGLYCTTKGYINDFKDEEYGKNIYKVRIPDEAQVYIEGPNKLKADMLEIVELAN